MKNIYRLFPLIIISLLFVSCGHLTYHVGDIVLDDGTVLSQTEMAAYKGSAEPVAFIFSVTGGEHENSKRVLGAGLKISEPLVFTPEDSESYGISIQANYSMAAAQEYQIQTGLYTNLGFFGLTDGRKTWKNVVKADGNAAKSFADYPAYDYAVNYGIKNKIKKFEKGWYLPTAAEARMLVKSNMPDLPDFIWTSSQSYDGKENELVVNLITGSVETGFKDMDYSVCSIYCFAE